MDLKQAKITLEKINDLFHSLERDASNVSSIERDLMRGYIQQFYEHFISSGLTADKTNGSTAREKVPARRNYTPPRIIEIPDAPRDSDSAPKPDPTRRPNPQPPPRPEPRPTPKPEPEPKPDPRPTPPPPPRPEPDPEPRKPEPVKVAHPVAPSPHRSPEIPGNLKHLFAFKEATDLSEKLSERPVQDLTKALAINDRLLYMNELFGRDLNALNDTLGKLNQMNSMDQARELIILMAQRYDWAAEEKEDTARDFIRLVRRKYQ